MSYGQPSRYAWADEDGTRSWINQAEGGEQGDPLMPLLFSLGIKGALATVQEQLGEGEFLFAFLDDVYAVCAPERVGEVYMALEKALREQAGIQLHEGKTKVWNKAGVQPQVVRSGEHGVGIGTGPGVGESEEARVERIIREAWSPEGVKVLGTPVGSPAFVEKLAKERMADEQELLDAIPYVPDLQCAWTILLQCAVLRA